MKPSVETKLRRHVVDKWLLYGSSLDDFVKQNALDHPRMKVRDFRTKIQQLEQMCLLRSLLYTNQAVMSLAFQQVLSFAESCHLIAIQDKTPFCCDYLADKIKLQKDFLLLDSDLLKVRAVVEAVVLVDETFVVIRTGVRV